jgi:two-component system CitB family response regulator
MQSNQAIEVLIIEDDLRIAEIEKRFIEQLEGFVTVGIATSYLEANTFIELLQPDLLLLDVYFPDMNGLDLLKEAKQQAKQLDVIMITATKEIDMVQEAISIGVFDFIIKPVMFERFKQALLRYREYYLRLQEWQKEKGHLTQQQVDMLLRKELDRGSASAGVGVEKANLPKGIDRLTLVKVLEVLGETGGGLTAEWVAKEIGVSRTTARRYLEHLVSEDQIEADLSYGTVGRPERVYIVK